MNDIPPLEKKESFFSRHKRHAPAAALLVGAIFDWLTLGRPDTLFANASILSYLVFAGMVILIVNWREERGKPEMLWLIVLLQFCFGNLASGLLVLYSQSATLAGSWLFLLILLGFLIGNEFARARYARLRSHLIAYHILLCAYLGIIVPILMKTIGGFTFFIAMIVALAIMFLYIRLLRRIAPQRMRAARISIAVGLGGVFIFFNILYFFNLIPPVPLSLTHIGVYQGLTRVADTYQLLGEPSAHWYDIGGRLHPTIHMVLPGSLYCFSAVFAPTDLKTPIYHRWEEYVGERWQTRSRIAYPLSGGREAGYRGYTLKTVTEGQWRCSVETEGGDVIGREIFTVLRVEKTPPLTLQEQ